MDDRRTRVAKALRGDYGKLPWDEASEACRGIWLARADEVLADKGGKLVEDWKTVLLKSWSVRLAVLAPVALSVAWDILATLPPDLRAYVKLPVFVLFAVLAAGSRIWKQE